MTFQEKLVILRKTRGLTQDEFASAVGVSRQAVYKWESGQSYPEVQKLLEIKTLFSISIDDLLDDNFDVPKPEKKRRKRIPKETKEQIEKTVEKKEAAAAPKAAPSPMAAPTEEPAPKAEPVTVAAAAANAPAAEAFNIVVNEEPKAETKAEESDEKRGFFGKFFGRR